MIPYLTMPELTTEAVDQLLLVEQLAWAAPGANITAAREKIEARLRCWREGVTLGLVGDKPAGSQYAFRINWPSDISVLTTWDAATCEGWYDKIHDPAGDTGFLVGVGVVPEFRGIRFVCDSHWEGERKFSELLIARTLATLFNGGVRQVIACARIPAYHQWPDLSVSQYCALRRGDGKLFDPVLRFHEGMGARVVKPVAYAMDDLESRDGGAWVLYERSLEWYR